MKDGVSIINVARGGVINEEALLNAINNGKVRAAALDVYTSEPPTNKELINSSKVIATPHLGAATTGAQENVALDIANQLVIAFREGKIFNSVNGFETLKE